MGIIIVGGIVDSAKSVAEGRMAGLDSAKMMSNSSKIASNYS